MTTEPAVDPADECLTCGELDGEAPLPEDVCPKSERPCGHHCNHVWTDEHCHWCEGEYKAPDENSDPVWVPGA